MNGLPVEKDTFVGADEKTYRGLQYDMLHHIWEAARGQDDRITKIESHKWWNKAASASGGIIGGMIAVITYLKFWMPK